jgi:ABC-2 type transport system permease protein
MTASGLPGQTPVHARDHGGPRNDSRIGGQFAAIAWLRWRLFQNGMRTTRGRLEVVFRIFMALGFFMLGLGGALGIAAGSWYFVSHGKVEGLAIFLYVIFLYWQLFPVVGQALSENIDPSHLLRYPLTYRGFFLVRLAYGSFEPATAIGILWVCGVAAGILIASLKIFLLAAPVLALFVLFNIFFARMVFAWIEKWLARRQTREILGVLLLCFIVGVQFINPVAQHFLHHRDPRLGQYAAEALPVERALPPGMAAACIAALANGEVGTASLQLGALTALTTGCFFLLHLRLRAYYFGEDLSEGMARATPAAQAKESAREKTAVGWSLPFVSTATSAVVQKEARYLMRSGPTLFTLIMPVVILVIFRFTAGQAGRNGAFLAHAADLAFPVGAAYTILILTNLVYNSLGTEGVGIQTYFLAPARFSEILLGKNVTHMMVMATVLVLVFFGAWFLYAPPDPLMIVITLAAVVYAAFVNLTAGNLMTLYSPKKIDLAAFGRQRASTATAFASLGVQAVTLGLAALVVMATRAAHMLWLAAPIFLVLAGIAAAVYMVVLRRVDGIAIKQRETLITELCRA